MPGDVVVLARERAQDEWRRDRALRKAARSGVCPECGDLEALLGQYRRARWLGADDGDPPPLRTPEGEQAACSVSLFRATHREAVGELLLATLCETSGGGFVEVVATPSGPWPRANLWFDADGFLVLLASAGERTAAYDLLFDHCLPPVRRCVASGGAATAANLRLLRMPPAGVITPQPSVAAALDRLIREAEERWLDRPERLLGGATPRAAWSAGPAARADLRRLLHLGTNSAPALYGELAAFDAQRVLRLLAGVVE